MDVFVTGATGYIGGAVARAFARRGHRVLGLARSAEKGRALERCEVEPVVGTLSEPDAWRERAGACAVAVHCAADYAADTFALDRAAIEALCAPRAGPGAPRTVVYTSGVWVYGDTGGRRVDEASDLHPIALVAARVESERMVLGHARADLRPIVIRPGCVYGGQGSLTASWFDTATRHGAARIVGDGSQRWAMVHLDDLADLYVRAGESALAAEAFNATDRSRSSVRECAAAASRAAGADGRVEAIPAAEARKKLGGVAEALALDQHVDSGKAARLLGWTPRHAGFADEVERLHRAWRAHRAAG